MFVGVPWVNDRWLVEQSERALNFCSIIKDYDVIGSNVFLVKLKLRLPQKGQFVSYYITLIHATNAVRDFSDLTG